MGCSPSKVDQEEAVGRCRERRELMSRAVAARNAFASAHSAFVVTLRSTGGALHDYATGETSSSSADHHGSSTVASAVATPPPPVESLPLPPPPLPNFSPAIPLQRAKTMPDIVIPEQRKPPPPESPIDEEDEDEHEDEDEDEDESEIGEEGDDEHDEQEEHQHDLHRRSFDPPPAAAASAAASASPPPLPPEKLAPATPPPPMPEPGRMGAWDYFFADTMPPPTLSPVDDEPPAHWPERSSAQPLPAAHAAAANKVPVHDNDDPRPATQPPQQTERLRRAEKFPSKPVAKKPPLYKQPVHYQHAASMGASDTRKGKMLSAAAAPSYPLKGRNLLEIIKELDEQFLMASESAQDVSKMLEATRMHYHSNFADSRGHIDHSAIIMRVITWNKSFKNLPQQEDAIDMFGKEENESHAVILDKMLAWEKKLYDEVKAGELMKIEYQRKVALLNKQKKRGVQPESLEKTKAAVSHLHTRYIVDMQSLDSTVLEINRLRDHHLYPKLIDLVNGMERMWDSMKGHHRKQLKTITSIKQSELTAVLRETHDLHYQQTVEFRNIVRQWHMHFEEVMKQQKEYIRFLNGWLKLNLIPIESSLKEKVSSPPRQLEPPIKDLLYTWQDSLERLPLDLARSAIKSFAEVINNILLLQEEELNMKRKCDDTAKDLERTRRQLAEMDRKYMERRASLSEANPGVADTAAIDDALTRKKAEADVLASKLKEEQDGHMRLCQQVREKSLGSLRTHLPELFRNLAEFASSASAMYRSLPARQADSSHVEDD